MKTHVSFVPILSVLLALVILNVLISTAHAQGTAFSYQGQLQTGGTPASGTYNLEFSLYTNATGGAVVAGPVTNSAVTIANGLFTVAIDFGAAVWNGQTNWLQIAVETNGASSFTSLSPRQQIMPVPYAITAESLDGTLLASQLTSIGNTNGGSDNFFVGPSGNATTAGSYDTALGAGALLANTIGNYDTAIGFTALFVNTNGSWNTALGMQALFNNYNGSIDTASGVNALYSNTSGSYNTADGMDALFANSIGYYNTANGYQALFNNTSASYNTANGAFALNSNTTGTENTANGYKALQLNTVGNENTADGDLALENNSSGSYNTATGVGALTYNTANYNTADGAGALDVNNGGSDNVGAGYAALGDNVSGSYNVAVGVDALLNNAGGSENTAVGFEALDALGYDSGIGGTGDIAIGYLAGTAFTENESGNIDIGNAGIAGESDIIRIGAGQSATYLSGKVYGLSFNSTSDRNAKEHVAPIDPRAVLAKVASLPVTIWNFKVDKTAQHIGPMAQDFHAAFGLNGGDDKHISVVDEGGVAFAAIQGLNQIVEEGNRQQEARIQAQAAQIQSQSAQIQQLQQSIAQLKAIVSQLAQSKGE